MAYNHAYVSAPGTIIPVINHLRKAFPVKVTADTLKKLGFAPKNESYILNILRFLGLLDENGKKCQIASEIFSMHDDKSFSKAFSEVVKKAYADLFELHGDKTWSLDSDSLITFFRQSDHTSEITGKRQAATFRILAGFSGHSEMPQSKSTAPKETKTKATKHLLKAKRNQLPAAISSPTIPRGERENPIGLTVRIEINLPSDGNQETYNRIFRSIRENLLNG